MEQLVGDKTANESRAFLRCCSCSDLHIERLRESRVPGTLNFPSDRETGAIAHFISNSACSLRECPHCGRAAALQLFLARKVTSSLAVSPSLPRSVVSPSVAVAPYALFSGHMALSRPLTSRNWEKSVFTRTRSSHQQSVSQSVSQGEVFGGDSSPL